MPADSLSVPSRSRRERQVDFGLSALLVLQGFTLFFAIPLGGSSPAGRVLLDICHLAFAIICIGVLTRHRGVQSALLAALVVFVGAPLLGSRLRADLHLDPALQHELIASVAFAFNAGVTVLVARHVFAPGQVTVHRVRGAILLYLNVAALFAIAYGAIALNIPDAFAWTAGSTPGGNLSNAAFSYFSLATITTTGYGDIAPVHALARSLANLESVFGQLYPATLLTRLVTLHLTHEQGGAAKGGAANGGGGANGAG